MEVNLEVKVKNLGSGGAIPKVSKPTNAYVGDRSSLKGDDILADSDGWLMLTGIDVPDPGCWEISAEYLGQTLTFVVETQRFEVASVVD